MAKNPSSPSGSRLHPTPRKQEIIALTSEHRGGARIAEAMARCSRAGAPVTSLLIDIDHFKDINDTHGHAVGDAVLCGVMKLINARSRNLDRLFRMGVAEFLLLLADTRLADGLSVGEALRQAIATAKWSQDVMLTVSIGVSEYVPGETQDSWMKRADISLNRAKHSGRKVVAG